ncbi:MAG: GAF domain-containing protein [Deltaproteobacteria bacterium]|nr:GAF domain-containing protein [Deltaproteobacteria bacterium]
MDIRTLSSLLASIVGVALGVSMLLRTGRPRALTRFATVCLMVGAYHLSQFLHALQSGGAFPAPVPRVAESALFLTGALVPAVALQFFLEFLNVSRRSQRLGARLAYFSPILTAVVVLTPLFDLGWARVTAAAFTFGALATSLGVLLYRVRRTESRIERLRLTYLAVGGAATVLFTALDQLNLVGIPFPTVGPVMSTVYLLFLSQTLLRLRLMDLQEFLGKVASQAVLAAILAAVFATLTIWVDANPSLFLFNTVVAAFVMLILSEPLRDLVEGRVVAVFFRQRFELLRALTALRQRVAHIIEVQELATVLLDAFNETRRVTHASLYLLAEGRPGYRLLAHRGPAPATFVDMGAARVLLAAVGGGQKALLLEHLDRRTAELRAQSQADGTKKTAREELKRLNDLRALLVQMKAGICMPLLGNDRVIGFLNLWDERVQEAYASDEIAQLLEIAERVATVVENSKLYDRMRERDRLAALGEMSAGLAHEIRNPLGAIKGAAQCLDPRKLGGEEGEFLEVILEEVDRLNGVVTAFLNYARPLKQTFAPTDLNEVSIRTARLIQNDLPSTVTLALELAEELPRVEADPEQLKQVLINLVQNAVQALGENGGRIALRTVAQDRFGDFRAVEAVELHVADDGPGIPPDQQVNIFVPFFTTKQKGTGLGLAISQRIVRNHGGNISVQSRVGEGTTFVIRLPVVPASPPLPSVNGTEAGPATAPASS